MAKGSCACGEVKFEYSGEPESKIVCHCWNCKKNSSSMFGVSFLIPDSNFQLTTGESKLSNMAKKNGNMRFCSQCGSTVYIDSPRLAGKIILKAGVIDDANFFSDLKPNVELFTSRRPTWLAPIEGATQFEEHFPGMKSALESSST